MVGKKIRAFREFRGYSQIQLAELSGINVGTIRKYELGIRNPKPDQLEKIATALGLNVSVFLDFNIETVGDVLSLLFSIDDSVNLSLAETPDQKVSLTFDNPTMQDFFRKWCQFKNVYEKEKAEILAIENEDKRQEELDAAERIFAVLARFVHKTFRLGSQRVFMNPALQTVIRIEQQVARGLARADQQCSQILTFPMKIIDLFQVGSCTFVNRIFKHFLRIVILYQFTHVHEHGTVGDTHSL